MIYYFGDAHLGHANVIKHDGRPFSNVDEMDKTLINNYNNIVNNNDDVYITGDLFYRNKYNAEDILKKLKGKKHLIIGNHDKHWLKNKELRKYFVEITDIVTIKDEYSMVVISHYPLAEWDGYFRGYYHVYAHIHNNINETYNFMKTKEKALNSGCMINGYKPVALKELIINNKIFKEEH